MLVTQKSQYALRAIFELARRGDPGPTKLADIAEAQAIPPRFLELILGQLRQAGFVASRRGAKGGYVLAKPAREITVGAIIRAVHGPIGPVECVARTDRSDCPLYGGCVFLPMWQEAQAAMAGVFDKTSLADLVEDEKRRAGQHVLRYTI
jgi:Rrf2 family protein